MTIAQDDITAQINQEKRGVIVGFGPQVRSDGPDLLRARREPDWAVVCYCMQTMVDLARPGDGNIHKRVFIQASAGTIYRALTDAKALSFWFCDKATSDPRIDGELTAHWRTGKAGMKGRAVYRQLVPDLLVELLWVDEGTGADPAAASHRLVYTINQRKSACEVIVDDQDSNIPDDETYAILDKGWNAVLNELKDYCESAERSLRAPSGREP